MKLTDLARLESGHTPSRKHPEYWGGDVPWVSLPDARQHHGRTLNDTTQKTNALGLANSAARLLPKGTVCLSRTASVGYVFMLGRPMATSQDFVDWVCSEALDPRFLMYALIAEGDHILNFGKGSTHTTIYFPEVLAFHLCVPPLPEQRRIVAKVEELLAQVNAARERLAKVPALLKRFRQSVLAAACSGRLTEEWRVSAGLRPDVMSALAAHRERRRAMHDDERAHRNGRLPYPTILEEIEPDYDTLPGFGEVPDGWALVAVGNACERLQYGTSVKADEDAARGVPMLRMGNIQDGRLDLTELKYVVETEELLDFRLAPGDLLFNRTNSPDLVGKSAVVTTDRPLVFASYLVRVQTIDALLNPSYLGFWINSPLGRSWAGRARTDGVSQSNINATKLAQMPLPLPALDEQIEIVRRVESLFILADAIEQHVVAASTRADQLTQAILAKAFRAELVPTEAELARKEGRTFESAAEMLERVSAQQLERTSTRKPQRSSTPRKARA